MSEEKIGRLLAVTEALAVDVQDIKRNMVTRIEFDLRVNEHVEFRDSIAKLDDKVDALESHKDKTQWVRKIGDRALFVIVGIAVTALVGFFFGG